MWVIVDVPEIYLGNITIYGTLEFPASGYEIVTDFTLDCELIYIAVGGRLAAGYDTAGEHFSGSLTINLRGTPTSPPKELVLDHGPAIGKKAIGMSNITLKDK